MRSMVNTERAVTGGPPMQSEYEAMPGSTNWPVAGPLFQKRAAHFLEELAPPNGAPAFFAQLRQVRRNGMAPAVLCLKEQLEIFKDDVLEDGSFGQRDCHVCRDRFVRPR
jgi:hypothetical protein